MPPPATIDLPEEDEKKSIDELIKILEAQKRRDIRGILRRPEGQAVDEPLMQQVVEEDEERKEEKRRKEMEGYEKPDPELTKMRQSLRSPLFTQQIPEMTGAAQERAREMLKTEEGEISSKPYEGQSAWESFLDVGEKATRVIKKTAGLDYLFEWLMPEEEAGIVAGETRKGIGGIAGLKVGLDAQKLLPHPALKAAAPVVGMWWRNNRESGWWRDNDPRRVPRDGDLWSRIWNHANPSEESGDSRENAPRRNGGGNHWLCCPTKPQPTG